MLPQNRAKRNLLLELAMAGIDAVRPEKLLARQLAGMFPGRSVHLLAIGKAANGLATTAVEVLGDRVLDGLVIAPEIAQLPARLQHCVGEHPLPGQGSLAAGDALVGYLERLDDAAPLLLLLSGGGSALVEKPAPGIRAEDVQRLHEFCLGSGLPIAAVNAIRARISVLKAGGLAALAGEREKQALVISDVMEAGPEFVSSGPFSPALLESPLPSDLPDDICALLERAPYVPRSAGNLTVIADNAMAVTAVRNAASERSMEVSTEVALRGDVEAMAEKLAREIRDMPPGLLLAGGETTVTLPDGPGRGGRNQQLALALARELEGVGRWCALVIGTDGIDGNSDDAGALVDGQTIARAALDGFDAADALRQANAGPLLEVIGDLVHTGPTGTNVADLFLALKW